jgi:hypothetical protein
MMRTRRYRTVLARLGSVTLVLLLGTSFLGAQEETKKEPPNRGGAASKQAEKQAEKQAGQAQEKKPAQPANKPAQPPQRTQPPDQPAPNTAQPRVNRPAEPRYQPRQQPQYRPSAERENSPQQQRGGRGAASAPPPRSGAFGRVVTTRGGDIVQHDQAGKVREVRMRNGATVYHAPTGLRRMEVARPGGRVVVVDAPGHGYVQRQVLVNRRPMVKRTYYRSGVSYVRMFRPVTYRGLVFNIYTPVHYYRPPYYAYLFNPWSRPVMWSWGWSASPWYGYYGGYFTPYRYYSSPLLWLTDYFVAATLQAAYEDRMAANLAPAPIDEGDVALSPEVKDLIAEEVRRQIDRERAESQFAGSGYGYRGDDVPVWADGASHVFVAYAGLGVNSNAGYCTIGEGDVLQLNQAPAPYSDAANLLVLASRRYDCRRGSIVAVRLEDLQDMDNHMREAVQAGLGDLQAHQGQNGIPPLPAGAAGVINSPYAADATPDPDASVEINQAYQDTDQAEQAALSQAASEPSAATPTVSLGQSIEQVRAILGPPQQIMDVGARQIYIYRNVKITFVNGRVSDIQ